MEIPSTPPTSSRKRLITICASNYNHHHHQQQQATTDATVRLSKRRQLSSPFISQAACVVCMETELQLVQLGSCGHAVCRSCMTSALLHAFKLQQLPLRCPMPHCKAQLQLQPAVQLLEQQVPGSSALAAKVLLAATSDLALIPHHLRCNCPYTDCQVPLEFPDEPLPDVPLDCPSCQRAVCSTCRSKWHSGLSCAQHQSLQASRSRTRAAAAAAAGRQAEQQYQQHGPFMPTRASAAAAAAMPSQQLSGRGGGSDGMAAWLQQQAQWQQAAAGAAGVGSRPQDGQAASSGAVGDSDAMMWSPAKGPGPQ